MAFDSQTRNRLARFVADARKLITDEFIEKFQSLYGLSPSGEITPLADLGHLDEEQKATAERLRARLHHLEADAKDTDRVKPDTIEHLTREQAFTVLNRLAAIRMAERRGIIIESVGRGYESKGFKVYIQIAGTALGDIYHKYRRYLCCLFDELAVDLGALFDRRSSAGLLFLREPALLQFLQLLNAPDLEPLWAEDETIGWIYQYYNDPAERKKMREQSSAPRNSRELAVRNQFFTPRYVVEFLTDNTLGRIWYEMTKGQTRLKEQCRYLVRRPNEIFLGDGETAPESERPVDESPSQEELLKQPVYVPHRPLKDPRSIKMLDPACGSMHFGLYAFDLFEVIYDEAWEIAHRSDDTLKLSVAFEPFIAFAAQYPDKAAFLREIPGLIVEHNIHGIDIDQRCAQIAGLSLWLRAQRSWQQQRLQPAERPQIRRSNIVCGEPMPGEEAFLNEFIEAQLAGTPEKKLLGQLVRRVSDHMKLAGEAGSLLKIEEEIAGVVAEAKQKWLAGPKLEQGHLFTDDTALARQEELALNVTGVTDETFWEKAEERIYTALHAYSEQAEEGGYRRRLFAEDAAHGFAFIDLCRKRYDIVLMNPPFGRASTNSCAYIEQTYPSTKSDIYASFVERWLTRLEIDGCLGAITSRTGFFLSSFKKWREDILLPQARPALLADLGGGVLDTAMVETAAYCLRHGMQDTACFFRLIAAAQKSSRLSEAVDAVNAGSLLRDVVYVADLASFGVVPGSPFSYWVSKTVRDLFRGKTVDDHGYVVRLGMQTNDDFRLLRLSTEVPQTKESRDDWRGYAKGGEYSPYYYDHHLMVLWDEGGKTIRAWIEQQGDAESRYLRSRELYGRPGLTWPRRTTSGLSVRILPAGCNFGEKGPALFGPIDELMTVLGLLNSAPFSALISLQLGAAEAAARSYEVGIIQRTPFPDFESSVGETLRDLATDNFNLMRNLDRDNETSRVFSLPHALPPKYMTLREQCRATNRSNRQMRRTLTENQAKINDLALDLYGFKDGDRRFIEDSNDGHCSSDETKPDDGDETINEVEETRFTAGLLSYLFGCIFARWDVRYATGSRRMPEFPEPFAPLPICPPGQLQNEQGLPLTKEEVRRLEADGRWFYPLDPLWDGILVDDPAHVLDLEVRVHRVLQIIWKDDWESIEREACEILGIGALRDYFRKPAGFFADHLKRYSRSRRQAPIYWPLSTTSGSYTLWVYYHRLTDQTLHTILADFLEPKIKTIDLEAQRQKDEGKTQKYGESAEFLDELEAFRAEIERIIKLPWKPNLNDGVLITASPLWKLFQFGKWQKDLKACWEELQRGDYDWAHLAYAIWPDRVKETCETDRSLAIAHGLEELCTVKGPKPKKGKTPNKKAAEEEGEKVLETEVDLEIAPKPAKEAKASAVKDLEARPIPIDQTDRTEVLCTIRQLFSDSQARDRDTAIHEVAAALGYQRVGPRIREILHTDLLTAVRRGILQNQNGQLSLLARDLRDYQRDFLKENFLSAIGRAWIERAEAIQAFARWLGFSRTGSVIEETGYSLINGLLRERRLEADKSQIRRAPG
jgi:hypothetical protein